MTSTDINSRYNHGFSKQEVAEIRKDFPILATSARGNKLIYLDNAATAQKPTQCIEAVDNYYKFSNANVHRGVHYLSEKATKLYEDARNTIANFINATSKNNIVFTRGTTESINLVANGFSRKFLKPGDEILLTELEHHSNIIPWQLACEYTGAKIKVIPINPKGELDLTNFDQLLTNNTKLLSLNYISNAIGTINPVKEIIAKAKAKNIPVLLDGAQATPHTQIDVIDLDCDFFAFSAHKCFGPTGVGALYAKSDWLNTLPPYQGGGEMITQVSFDKSVYQQAPYKFEAGTPNIAGAIGFAEAIKYLTNLDQTKIQKYENYLREYLENKLLELKNYKIIGQAEHKASVVSFLHNFVHPHDIGTILDMEGIAIRAGHHCAMPLMNKLQVPATVRASLCFYNTEEEIDKLIIGLKKTEEMFT